MNDWNDYPDALLDGMFDTLRQLAYDEGADITDGATDDEK